MITTHQTHKLALTSSYHHVRRSHTAGSQPACSCGSIVLGGAVHRTPSTLQCPRHAPLLDIPASYAIALLATQHTLLPPSRSPLPTKAPSSSFPTATTVNTRSACTEYLATRVVIELGDALGPEAIAELTVDLVAHCSGNVPTARPQDGIRIFFHKWSLSKQTQLTWN